MNFETIKAKLKAGVAKINEKVSVKTLGIGAIAVVALIGLGAIGNYAKSHNPPDGALDRTTLEAAALAAIPGEVEDIRYGERAGYKLAMVEVETLDGHARIMMNAETGEILRMGERGKHGKQGERGKHGDHGERGKDRENHGDMRKGEHSNDMHGKKGGKMNGNHRNDQQFDDDLDDHMNMNDDDNVQQNDGIYQPEIDAQAPAQATPDTTKPVNPEQPPVDAAPADNNT